MARLALAIAIGAACLAAGASAAYFVTHPITCDYDIAGLPLHLDRGGHPREFVPVTHLLMGPTVAAFGHLLQQVAGPTKFISIWMLMVVAAVMMTASLVFLTCWRLTTNLTAAAAGTALFIASGSTTYLARVLEDNLLGTVWLAMLLLCLAPRSRPPATGAFAVAGLAWGAAMLYGFAAITWGLVIAAAAHGSTPMWSGRLARFTVATALAAALFLTTAAFVSPLWLPAPINPLSRFGDAPHLAMFQAAHAPDVRLRYVLLGVYSSLLALPSAVGQEWNAAYTTIATDGYPGVAWHATVTTAISAFVVGVCRRRDRRDPTTPFARVCAVGLLGLTLWNLTAIDGSFVERFDYVPLLVAPLVALAVAGGHSLLRPAALALTALVMATTIVYGVRSARPDATMWSFAESKALADLRRGQEPIVIVADIGTDYDLDPLSLNAGLWLGRDRTFLIPTRDDVYRGYYAIRPLPNLVDDSRLHAWFLDLMRTNDSAVINDTARRRLAPVIAGDAWSSTQVLSRTHTYWRIAPSARPPR